MDGQTQHIADMPTAPGADAILQGPDAVNSNQIVNALHSGNRMGSTPSDAAGVLARLSPAQRRVAELVATGLSNKEVAYLVGISEDTVKVHTRAVFAAAGVRNRTQFALLMNRQGAQASVDAAHLVRLSGDIDDAASACLVMLNTLTDLRRRVSAALASAEG